jgi:hypothetical protein
MTPPPPGTNIGAQRLVRDPTQTFQTVRHLFDERARHRVQRDCTDAARQKLVGGRNVGRNRRARFRRYSSTMCFRCWSIGGCSMATPFRFRLCESAFSILKRRRRCRGDDARIALVMWSISVLTPRLGVAEVPMLVRRSAESRDCVLDVLSYMRDDIRREDSAEGLLQQRRLKPITPHPNLGCFSTLEALGGGR